MIFDRQSLFSLKSDIFRSQFKMFEKDDNESYVRQMILAFEKNETVMQTANRQICSNNQMSSEIGNICDRFY